MTKEFSNGEDVKRPNFILNCKLVMSIREVHANLTKIAEYEYNDLLEQFESEWDPD
jgi:hypothetical protein